MLQKTLILLKKSNSKNSKNSNFTKIKLKITFFYILNTTLLEKFFLQQNDTIINIKSFLYEKFCSCITKFLQYLKKTKILSTFYLQIIFF